MQTATGLNPKLMAINNVTSCLYILILVLWLHLTNSLFDVGHFNKTYLQWVLLFAEVVKYIIFNRYNSKEVKKNETKKSKSPGVFKTVAVLLGMIATYYVVAVFFGAPFFSKQQETFTFALTMTILTVLPCSLYLGGDKSVALMLSLASLNITEQYKQFLALMQFTCLGAWLGAVVIPLDWDRTFQVWPVPCILGALAGLFFGHFVLLVLYVFERKNKKKLKAEC
ncbi:phosphatidylinositol-glycan biosynthesis class F protein [Anthonomus grandis grandis]|uniref:phosphatidylinositol-glycan biosynthesis class F protein n=1 Tax=Anthonomus grandis grandis TaxID=2921223 RepID=UPI00216521DC|nr:phosphatidylinositol-glycan biosynthesis class F protein [Anthonomus grandis grandis]